MPATEKTWRDQLKMHVIFGITSLIMLFSTVWMLWKDHNREWRQWQLADRERAHWTIQAQLEQTKAESQARRVRLSEQLAQFQRQKIDPSLITEFRRAVEQQDDYLAAEGGSADPTNFSRLETAAAAHEAADPGTVEVARTRADVIDQMNDIVAEAKRRELALVGARKFMAADLTATMSLRGIAVGEGRSTEEYDRKIRELNDNLAAQDVKVANAKTYRLALERIVGQAQSDVGDVQKQIAAIDADVNRLQEALGKNPVSLLENPLEPVARWPIVDAFNTGNIKLDQIWLPDMKINYNFSSVARYDRCINCHRAIDKTAPGSATEPAYPAIPPNKRLRTVGLAAPATFPEIPEGASNTQAIESIYGLRLADRGQVIADDVTIQVVFPDSAAAKAGLITGDVITAINGGKILSQEDVASYLIDLANPGTSFALEIRRGLSQPFTSHPRLDLFVGSTSPHKRGDMGCTICHDGQGSATEFKWVSHTPNTPQQAQEWAKKYGWFDNHHWIFPMTPKRFVESNCLKCHHEVVELEPSERFPEPPAPKLLEGYQLVRQFGCYGCHEITGFDGPNNRIGPDLRIEPNYNEVAKQLLTDGGLNETERDWADTLIAHPENRVVRDDLYRAIQQDADRAKDSAAPAATDAPTPSAPRMTKATHQLGDALRDVEIPGSLRKVGPSLRHLSSKVDFDWVFQWVRRPADFRPTTRMPQFFGLHEHLDGQNPVFTLHNEAGEAQPVTDLEYTRRFENIEIHALSEYLLEKSQPFEYIAPPAGITEQPSAERGRWLFESRGCLACHSHGDFPGIAANQGPDLSRLGSKLNTDRGRRWLYSWLKQPNHYDSRTVMPNLFLDPIHETDTSGAPTGRVSDPAADIEAFLLDSSVQWQPEVATPSRQLSPQEARDLEDLTAVWLAPSFQSKRLAEKYAHEGIPESISATVKADELVLVGMTDADRVERQLEYVARRSISRYGCFGCHDVPGFETAKPIGTPLANWGRKDTSQLAFENIGRFLETHGIDGNQTASVEHGEESGQEHGLDPADLDPDTGFFIQSLFGHQRIGFLWQKLRMPRGYDYQTTANKRYDERLRMPKFPFDAKQREAVMTFVLGLTSEPPDAKYIYKPSPRQDAIVQGRKVLDKYNCAGCHVLEMERWDLSFAPGQFGDASLPNDYPFVLPHPTPDQLAESAKTNRRGLVETRLVGMPARNDQTGAPLVVDSEGIPLDPSDNKSLPYYKFTLYEHAVVNGSPRVVGEPDLLVPGALGQYGPAVGEAHAGWGGDLAKYLYPRVIAKEREVNPAAVADEAWAWLPPPLHHEGDKVRSEWLHDFLIDPIALRPAVFLRMPNFHMSSEEASQLANYFAAMSEAEYPYEYSSERRGNHLAEREMAHPGLLTDAMKIVTNSNYCVKCHSVGDFKVGGSVRAQGPPLDLVYQRLRADYLERWIASPKRILPYTAMPANIPYDTGVNQQLFPGTSTQQVMGVAELLLNYDEYAKRQTSIRELVGGATGSTPPGSGTTPSP